MSLNLYTYRHIPKVSFQAFVFMVIIVWDIKCLIEMQAKRANSTFKLAGVHGQWLTMKGIEAFKSLKLILAPIFKGAFAKLSRHVSCLDLVDASLANVFTPTNNFETF